MKEKSIRGKLFLVILGVAFSFAFLLFLTSLTQMYNQKNNIEHTNKIASKELSEETKVKLEEMNKQIARNFSQTYNEKINQNFESMRKNIDAVANYMQVLYELDTYSRKFDNRLGVMGGAKKEEILEEFYQIKGIRNFIQTIPDYDVNDLDSLDIYVVTDSGICLDGTSGSNFSNYEIGEYTDLRTTSWYKNAKKVSNKKEHRYYWASMFKGSASQKEKINCAVPFFDGEGTFKGVIAGDITKEHIKETVLQINEEQIDYVILFNEAGKVMLNPYEYKQAETLTITDEILIQDNSIITFTKLKETDWTICLIFRQDAIIEASEFIASSIEENAAKVSQIIADSIKKSIFLFLIIVAIGFGILLLISNMVSGNFVKPIQQLTKQVKIIGSGNLDQTIKVNSNDEIGQLANSFNDMTKELKDYMENIKHMTADKERFAAELNVAKKIQMNFLPSRFPAFPDREEFDIYAKANLVLEGGGNFYDFFFIDKRFFCIVIGDCTGTGIPTTLMAIVARTNIKNYAQQGHSPSRIMFQTNSQLSYNNEAGRTVAVFLGIIDLSTGIMDYINAGIKNPFWKHSGNEFIPLEGKSCIPLASMENVPYWHQSISLVQGDLLFLYTQGVSETIDVRGNIYTEEYLNEYLNQLVEKEFILKSIIDDVEKDLIRFSGGVEQKQDSTMMIFRYFG